jgi:hypothetical protein
MTINQLYPHAMRSAKKRMFAVALLLAGLSFQISPSAHSVENGTIIKDDPNAVYAYDGSVNAFLYSPWLIFSSAHLNEEWFKPNMVYHTVDGQQSHAEKILISDGYKDRVVDSESVKNGTAISDRTNDFAIVILSEPLVTNLNVRLLKKEEVEGLIANQTPVRMIGYSSHDSSKIKDGIPRILSAKLIEPAAAKTIFDYYLTNWHPNWGPKGAKYTLGDLNLVLTQAGGSGCDGDSGAGYFVQDGDQKIYLGPNGSHSVGVPNCGSPGIWGEGGNVSNIEPVYKHLDLIAKAEAVVAERDAKWKADLKAKAEAAAAAKALADKQAAEEKAKAEASASPKPTPVISEKSTTPAVQKVSITCLKGKLIKKITAINPKCPTGYKKK